MFEKGELECVVCTVFLSVLSVVYARRKCQPVYCTMYMFFVCVCGFVYEWLLRMSMRFYEWTLVKFMTQFRFFFLK